MIYISKDQSTVITTENVVDYVPMTLDVYLDEVKLGSYNNISNSRLYLVFEIPLEDISGYQEREYNMKITSHYATLKTELVYVKDYISISTLEVNNPKKIIMYEG